MTSAPRPLLLRRLPVLMLSVAVALLAGCSTTSGEAGPNQPVRHAWVELGDGGRAIARAVTEGAACPAVTVDGIDAPMTVRAVAGTAALRATASSPADSKPSSFPLTVCEAALPAGARAARIGATPLPLPRATPQRIVILADTGCRLKKADNTFQNCNDPEAWPLAQIAATAAAMKPDLVLHIGDYHYRENACPSDIGGCKDSPWGYGWDVWEADLFEPAAPLLAAAPWVVVRGNHEECRRAGQGWFRLLDTQPYDSARSCDDPANDGNANYSAPYAVPAGADTQFIVFDSARTGRTPLAPTDPQFLAYRKDFDTVARLAAKPGTASVFVNHHPLLGFFPAPGGAPGGGNGALLSVAADANPGAYYPAGVALALHGHVHDFQAIDFSSNHPATIVSGNGGDSLDAALPAPFPADVQPAPGVTVAHIVHSVTFGFMTMERDGGRWTFKAYTKAGRLMATCAQAQNRIRCDKTGFLAG
nr:metallophosphoesterase [uncultured Massilia sp.]